MGAAGIAGGAVGAAGIAGGAATGSLIHPNDKQTSNNNYGQEIKHKTSYLIIALFLWKFQAMKNNFFIKNKDKFYHFIVSAGIVFILNYLLGFYPAILISAVLAVLKEIWDDANSTGFSFYDLLAGILGILFAGVIIKW